MIWILGRIRRELAESVPFTRREVHEEQCLSSGGYVLRTSHADWSVKEVAQTYWRLTEIESSFRVMKSDLGLRPLYHPRDDRIEGHMLITVLAYHVAHLVRTCLKEEGFHQSWDTIRKELNRVKRITTVLPMSQMRSLVLNVDQNLTPLLEQIFQALGYRYDPKATRTKEVYQKPKNVPPKPPDS